MPFLNPEPEEWASASRLAKSTAMGSIEGKDRWIRKKEHPEDAVIFTTHHGDDAHADNDKIRSSHSAKLQVSASQHVQEDQPVSRDV